MKKIKFLLFLLILNLGIVQAHAADNTVDQSTLRLLDLFGDVFEKVKKDYVEETNDTELIESAINGMLTSLDPHSGYLNKKAFEEIQTHTKGEFGGLGIEVTMENGLVKVISPIDDMPAFKAGIKAGDYIISINDQAVMGMSLTEAVGYMRGAAGEKIHLTILRESKNEPLELDLVRELIKVKAVKSKNIEDISYIRINSFTEQTYEGLKSEINRLKEEKGKNLKGLVLDLRNNPGGLLNQAILVANAFLEHGEIVSTKGRNGSNVVRKNAKSGQLLTNAPMVVLINGGSASASEIVAGALQDHKRAIIMGTKSFGKGSVQELTPIPNFGALKLTNAIYYTPSGRSIQAEGIIPDIIVEEAKIEFLDSKDNRRFFSEASLKGHLVNESANKLKKIQDKPEITKDNNANLFNYDKDFQLARAVDLLKGINISLSNK